MRVMGTMKCSCCNRTQDFAGLAARARSIFGRRAYICGTCAASAYHITRGGDSPPRPGLPSRRLRRKGWCLAAIVALGLPACTSQQWYNTGQGWQHGQCERVVDKAERDRCRETAGGSYDEYARQRGDTLAR